MAMSSKHPEIPAEQRYIDHAATCLHEAQESARNMAEMAGSKHDARALKVLGDQLLERRLEAEDRICFARLDRKDTDRPVYIGRELILDGGKAIVCSWDTDAAIPYFRAGPGRTMGLVRRRRFELDKTTIVSITDEALASLPARLRDGSPKPARSAPPKPREALEGAPPLAFEDALLRDLEHARTSEMRDIVPTIQRDQFDLISAPPDGVLIVQGGPGTGKTAVALHRAAWLATNHRKQLGGRTGILVVGPNRAFMDYIAGVLPGLGKTDIAQAPVDYLVVAQDPQGRTVRAERPEPSREVAALKGDPRMADVIAQCAEARVRPPDESAPVTLGRTRLTFEPAEVRKIVRASWGPSGSRRAYMTARTRFIDAMRTSGGEKYRAAHKSRRAELDSQGLERALNARSGDFFSLLQRIWPSMSAPQLVHELFTVEQRLRDAADGVLDDRERDLLVRQDVKNVREQRWTIADVAIVDEADFVVHGARSGAQFGHVIVDEAQNLTPMQLRMVRRRSANGNIMLVGDLAQATGAWAHESWKALAQHLPRVKAVRVEEITTGYRVPEPVMRLASTLLPRISASLKPVIAVRPGLEPRIERVETHELAELVAVEASGLRERDRTVGIIVPPSLLHAVRAALAEVGLRAGDVEKDSLEKQVTLLPSSAATGLEFDNVLVVEPGSIVREAERGYSELYTVLSRPTQQLSVVHALPLPAPLPGGVEPEAPDAVEHPAGSSEEPPSTPAAAIRQAPALALDTAVMSLGGRFSEALVYAKLVHGQQQRRGTAVPFLSHLLAVCALVLDDGGNEDEAIAALLHDAAEDHHGTATVREIAERFGPEIAGIVALCTEPTRNGSTWRAVKKQHFETIEGAPVAARRVALAEKLDNARTIVRQLRDVGPELWPTMDVDEADILWYFGELARLFTEVHPGAMAAELSEQVAEMRDLAVGAV